MRNKMQFHARIMHVLRPFLKLRGAFYAADLFSVLSDPKVRQLCLIAGIFKTPVSTVI